MVQCLALGGLHQGCRASVCAPRARAAPALGSQIRTLLVAGAAIGKKSQTTEAYALPVPEAPCPHFEVCVVGLALSGGSKGECASVPGLCPHF